MRSSVLTGQLLRGIMVMAAAESPLSLHTACGLPAVHM